MLEPEKPWPAVGLAAWIPMVNRSKRGNRGNERMRKSAPAANEPRRGGSGQRIGRGSVQAKQNVGRGNLTGSNRFGRTQEFGVGREDVEEDEDEKPTSIGRGRVGRTTGGRPQGVRGRGAKTQHNVLGLVSILEGNVQILEGVQEHLQEMGAGEDYSEKLEEALESCRGLVDELRG